MPAPQMKTRRLNRAATAPISVLLGKWLIPGRSSVKDGPSCKQRLLYEVTISGLMAIQADPFKRGNQVGQSRAELAVG